MFWHGGEIMENKGTIYKVPTESPDVFEIKYKLDKIFTEEQIQAKLYYLLLKMYNKENTVIDKRFIYDICVATSIKIDQWKLVDQWLKQLEKIGVVEIHQSHIVLKMWDRRSHKIVPRNFMRDLQSLMYFEEIEKKYDQIHYGFGQKIKSFFKKLFG